MLTPIDKMSDQEIETFLTDPRNYGSGLRVDVLCESRDRAHRKYLAAQSRPTPLPQGVTVTTQQPNPWSLAGYSTSPIWGKASSESADLWAGNPKTKECRCESRHLFAFGHENPCDYYKEKK